MINFTKKKTLRNPYKPYNLTNIQAGGFVGRKDELEYIEYGISDFLKENRIDENILIIGEKSIGKSTLLKQFINMLDDNYEVYFKELSKERSYDTTRIFFEEIFHRIIMDYENEIIDNENDFFSVEFFNEWVEFYNGNHGEVNPRKLNIQKFPNRPITTNELIADFDRFIDALHNLDSDIRGLIIVVDEFQELRKNVEILEYLIELSANIPNFALIGAGLNLITTDYSEVFEKFSRSAIPFSLTGLDRHEIHDAIINPLCSILKLRKSQAFNLVSDDAIHNIVEKTNGNPLHIRILCGEMFEYFRKNDDVEKMVINDVVMQSVLDYYKRISLKSKIIENHLKNFDEDLLDSFRLIYGWCGLSIKDFMIFKNAFNQINDEVMNSHLKFFIETYNKISHANLFILKHLSSNKTIREIDSKKINLLNASEYTITFIGDHIDILFAYYYYKKRTGRELDSIVEYEQSFMNVLTFLLQSEVCTGFKKYIIENNKIDESYFNVNGSYRISYSEEEEGLYNNINQLKQFGDNDNKKLSKKYKKLKEEYSSIPFFRYLAIQSNLYEIQSYISISMAISFKGEINNFEMFIGLNNEEINKINLNNFDDYNTFIEASLVDYGIEIISFNIKFIPSAVKITLVQFVEDDAHNQMMQSVNQRDFKNALAFAIDKNISSSIIKRAENKILSITNDLNNLSFIHICLEQFDDAKKYLDSLLSDRKAHQSSLFKLNRAYIYFLEGSSPDAIKLYKRVLTKQKKSKHIERGIVTYIHLCLPTGLVKMDNTLAENVYTINIAVWNLMLLLSVDLVNETKISAYNSYKKCLQLDSESQQLINNRVEYWIKYYQGENDKALEKSRELLQKLQEINIADFDNLLNDVKKDVEILKNQ